jgi:hypothetical protein
VSNREDGTSRRIPAELANHVKGIVVRPVDYQQVDVAINLNEGLMVFVEQYYDAILQRLNQQGANGATFTLLDLQRYVVTLIKSRVMWVRNERNVPLHYSERVPVPAFLSFVLSGIGRVELPELGIELIPSFNVDSWPVVAVEQPPTLEETDLVTEEGEGVYEVRTAPMSREEAVIFGSRLKAISRLGFEFAEGYARDKQGVLDLMVLQLVEGTVVSHTDRGHPAYAVAAYFLGLLQVVNLLGPRVLYGTREQMRMILRLVASQ